MSTTALQVTGWVPSCWDTETALPARAETDQATAPVLQGSSAEVFTSHLKTQASSHCRDDGISSFVIG